MTYTLRILEVVEREIERASDYYLAEAPEHVDLFEDEVGATLERISRQALVPRIVHNRARAAHLNVCPYTILYVVHDELELIDVVALVHDRQDVTGVLPRL